MTTHNQPHKYRCETCNYRKIIHNYGLGTDRPRCELTKWFLDTPYPEMSIEKEFISIIGCASHSDAGKAEQQIADVIRELEKHKSKINTNISKTSEEKYIGYSMNEYRRTRIEEIDNALALLRGKEE